MFIKLYSDRMTPHTQLKSYKALTCYNDHQWDRNIISYHRNEHLENNFLSVWIEYTQGDKKNQTMLHSSKIHCVMTVGFRVMYLSDMFVFYMSPCLWYLCIQIKKLQLISELQLFL